VSAVCMCCVLVRARYETVAFYFFNPRPSYQSSDAALKKQYEPPHPTKPS